MPSPVPQILLTNTFDEWRIAFNDLLVGGPLDTDNIFVDAVNKRVGLFNPTPSSSLHIKTPLPVIALEDTSTNSVGIIKYDENSLHISADDTNNASGSAINFWVDGDVVAQTTKDNFNIIKPLLLNGTPIETSLHVEADNIVYSTGKLAVAGNLSYTGSFTKGGSPVPSSEFTFQNSGTGATLRNLQTHLRDRTSILDYGAVGNNSTNDTTAVLNAISSGFGVIDGVGRTYKIGSNISIPHTSIPHNLRIINAGFNISSNTSNYGFSFSGSQISEVSVSSNVNAGMSSIDVSSTAGMIVGEPLYLYSTRVLSNYPSYNGTYGEIIIIKRIVGNTIYTDSPLGLNYTTSDKVRRYNWITNLEFENCTFYGNGSATNNALLFSQIFGLRIKNCRFVNIMQNSILVVNSVNVDISNNIFEYTTELAGSETCSVEIGSPVYKAEIHSNTSSNPKIFSKCGQGLGVSRFISYHDNNVSGLSLSALRIYPQVIEHSIHDNNFVFSSIGSGSIAIRGMGLMPSITGNTIVMYNGNPIVCSTFMSSANSSIRSNFEIKNNTITNISNSGFSNIVVDIQSTGGVGSLNVDYIDVSKNSMNGASIDIVYIIGAKSSSIKNISINENKSSSVLSGDGISIWANSALIDSVNASNNYIECASAANYCFEFYAYNSGYIKNGSVTGNVLRYGLESFHFDGVDNIYTSGNNILTSSVSNIRYQTNSVGTVFGADTINGTLQGNSNEIMIVEERQPSGTQGGTVTVNAWNARALNTIVTNTIPGANLVSSLISLPPGTYDIEATTTFCSCSKTRVRFANALLTLVAYGPSSHSYLGTEGGGFTGGDGGTVSCAGRLIVPSTQSFNLSMWTTGTNVGASARGYPTNVPGVQEIYSQVIIKKVG